MIECAALYHFAIYKKVYVMQKLYIPNFLVSVSTP